MKKPEAEATVTRETRATAGLFILTQLELHWFPTSVPSVPWPYRLKADINGKHTSVHFDAQELLISQ